MRFRFPIVIIDEDFRSENASGLGIRALAKAIEAEGVESLGVTSFGDVASFAQQQSRASAFILSVDDEELAEGNGDQETVAKLAAFVREIRRRNADIPIFLYGETRTTQHLPNEVLRELHGFIHMFEDTPEFVARYIVRESRAYLDTLAPPFFRALVHYAQDGSYSWHCPGHSGGVAFLKSATRLMNWGSCSITPVRSLRANAMPHASSVPTTCSSSPTARRRRTRSSGTTSWRRVTWSSSTATATSRSCMRSR
jgi:arginine decarboxylase